MNPPVQITTAEEPGTIDRVQDPEPIGVTRPTEFLAEKCVLGPGRDNLSEQTLDSPVSFGDLCTVSLQRRRDAGLEVREGESCGEVRDTKRESQVIGTVRLG
jgi:hypothetical protein